MNSARSLRVANHQIALDADGHLADSTDWSRQVAEALAAEEGVALTSQHWWLIDFVRDYQQRYGTPPLMRVAVAELRTARDDPSLGSRELYRLFSDHPIRQACRLAGYPKPDWCI